LGEEEGWERFWECEVGVGGWNVAAKGEEKRRRKRMRRRRRKRGGGGERRARAPAPPPPSATWGPAAPAAR